jgi:hypothetical protein
MMWTNIHQCTIHWKPAMTYLWTNHNFKLLRFHVGKLSPYAFLDIPLT